MIERIAAAPLSVRTAAATADPPFGAVIPSSLRICLTSGDRRQFAQTRAYWLLPQIPSPWPPGIAQGAGGRVPSALDRILEFGFAQNATDQNTRRVAYRLGKSDALFGECLG